MKDKNRFDKLFRLFTLYSGLFLIWTALTPVATQAQYPYYAPAKERLTRVNLEVLVPHGYIPQPEQKYGKLIERLEESYVSHSIKDFIGEGAEENVEINCQSVLREGYKCYEINNTQIGFEDWIINGYRNFLYFRPIDSRSKTLQVFYHALKKQFFLKPSPAGDRIYGPFNGEPLAELKKAEFAAKERNTFPGVKFTYLSKRWEFPDEKDARLDKCVDYYSNHAMSRFTLRCSEKEDERLNSHFLRFRLENISGKNLYFLFYQNQPEVFQLDKSSMEGSEWSRKPRRKFNGESDYNLDWLNWVSLPNNSAIEFEVKSFMHCDIKQICAIGVSLNDEISFRDEVEIITIFPGNKRRKFSPQNAPPKRK